MADIEFDIKPASAVFIDVPNIAQGVRSNAWQDINWKRLSQAIASSEILVGTTLVRATAYVRDWNEGQDLLASNKVQFRTFGKAIDMQVRTNDDIDSLIIEDMWGVVAQHEQDSIQGGKLEYPLRVRFVIVSGDSDYLRTIRKLRGIYGSNLELEFIVYSWLSGMSQDLQDAANGYFYLDKVKGFKALGE